jgi:TM2 domain-containing membrane protein YozV
MAAILILAAVAVAQTAPATETQPSQTSGIGSAGSRQIAKNPSSALIYSIVLPGGGQLYNGETGRGLLHLGAAAVGYALFIVFLPSTEFVADDYYWASYGYWRNTGSPALSYGGLALALGSTVWSIIDAPRGARRYNERTGLASVQLGDHTLAVNLDNIGACGVHALGLRIGLAF